MLAISRRTRSRIILLILIPVLAYGAARVVVWYTVKEAVDHVRESLAPVASLRYAKIMSPVLGRFGVAGVRVRPHLLDDDISIGSALVNIDDPLDKLSFLRTARSRQFPTSLDMSFNHVRIPLSKEVVAWLDKRMTTPPASVDGVPAACRAGARATASDMKKMGYDELVGDVLVHYTYERRSGEIVGYVRLALQDMLDATVEATIPASEVVFNVGQLKGMPKFSKLSITLSDPSWTSRFNDYCAKAMGITVPEYIQRRITDTRQAFESANFAPSDALMKGLERFAAGKSRLTVTLDPRDPIALSQLNPMRGPDYLIDTLGLGVQFDGQTVNDLGAIKTAEKTESESAPQQPQEETFKPTSIEELPQYLKMRVRVLMTDGNTRRGYLDSIDGEKIVLTRQLVGGSATFDVALKDVKRVLVLRP